MNKTAAKTTSPGSAKGLTPEMEEKRHRAAIMYVVDREHVKTICEQLKISTVLFLKWSKAGYWNELCGARIRPKAKLLEAQVLYIKEMYSLTAISAKTGVSLPTLKKWKDAGAWDKLRPNIDIVAEFLAAGMYVDAGMTTNEIAMHLNVSETQVKMWVNVFKWDAARLIKQAENVTVAIIEDFSQFFNDSCKMPQSYLHTSWFDVIKNEYLRKVKPLM